MTEFAKPLPHFGWIAFEKKLVTLNNGDGINGVNYQRKENSCDINLKHSSMTFNT